MDKDIVAALFLMVLGLWGVTVMAKGGLEFMQMGARLLAALFFFLSAALGFGGILLSLYGMSIALGGSMGLVGAWAGVLVTPFLSAFLIKGMPA